MKTALITGIFGQDGIYLSRLLSSKGYKIYGLIPHRNNSNAKDRFEKAVVTQVEYIYGDMTDQVSIIRAILESKPDEVYNLAAHSFVGTSWNMPEYVSLVNGLGVLYLLEAIRTYSSETKFYQASTSEMFGNSYPDYEPTSPYGVSKLYAHRLTQMYRESYDMFCCSGILFNHESRYRGEHFVTQKIAKAAARISLGLQNKLKLGNINACRDIGHAEDYVRAMWLMLQRVKSDDYEIATGKTHSIGDMIEVCFQHVNLDARNYIEIDETLKRPKDIEVLKGEPSSAQFCLDWEPKWSFKEILEDMVDYQLLLHNT